MHHILLVDDHQVALNGIRHALAGLPDFIIIDHVVSGKEALEALVNNQITIVITDLYLGNDGITGIKLTEIIKANHKGVKVLMFSSEDRNPQVLLQAYRAGLDGYVPKSAPLQELVVALTKLSEGKPHFSSIILEKIAQSTRELNEPLTPTEETVLKLLADGKSRQQITSQILNRSANTYDSHLKNIKRKLNTKTMAELIMKAIRMGLISSDE
jgi:DNA-binding NarL/FixJ family response regulator